MRRRAIPSYDGQLKHLLELPQSGLRKLPLCLSPVQSVQNQAGTLTECLGINGVCFCKPVHPIRHDRIQSMSLAARDDIQQDRQQFYPRAQLRGILGAAPVGSMPQLR